jgi:hypothetical protein
VSGYIWCAAIGYLAAKVEADARKVIQLWRESKAKVNAVRREHGIAEEKRWWKL